MNGSILNVNKTVPVDESIINSEYHTHIPYSATSLDNNDEIRIPIQSQNIYTYPSESYIILEGNLISQEKGHYSTNLSFINNGFLHLFEECRYELGGTIIARSRFPGITSTLKGYASFTPNDCIKNANSGWSITEHPKIVEPTTGYFNVCIPLKQILGFGEDFKKIIINLQQELVLVRSHTDFNATITTDGATDTPKVKITKIMWKVPHISVSDEQKLVLLQHLEMQNNLEISFRNWSLQKLPVLPKTKSYDWTIMTVKQSEVPRYMIVGFQTDRENSKTRDNSNFDHCNLTNLKVYLNSEVYPYDNLNIDFKKKHYAIAYEMYARFQESYYFQGKSEPCLSLTNFIQKAPIFIIDCSHQNEAVKGGAVDVRLELESSENFPDNTSVYCLIIHDRTVIYNPLSNLVKVQ
ncbi:uncharacterized protein LOC126891523 [Diabrotica virgifera virgifera]|uniref:Double jelly roll-like domain-containing protein n=1 Tax=Diabrotica virgifera virgifera TaxID=50390 RepID=A0ABM5L2I5_DIAVI|nr:uncharacterized protein LOC126891523 [Diabrotica virgifera virgifera]